MKKRLFITTVALVVPFLFSCQRNEEVIVPVESISLDESAVTLKVGEEKRIHATVAPENATDKTLKWVSSHPNSVTAVGGLLHAYSVPKDGSDVTITAKDRNETVSASLTVHVNPKDPVSPTEADGITISSETLSFILDGEHETGELTATVTPLDVTSRDVEWETSDAGIIEITNTVQPSASGATLSERKSSKVTLHAAGLAGTATITATHGDFSASCAVKVSEEEGKIQLFAFGQKEISVEEGETTSNTLTVLPYNALEGETVTYTSTNPAVASVDIHTGIVTAHAESAEPVTITAVVDSHPEFTDTYKVYVTHRFVNYLHIHEKNASRWTSEDISLKQESQTEYKVTRNFTRGDEFCFCIGRTDWYKYDTVKDGCGQGVNFTQNGENIKILMTGTYTIYVETAEGEQHGIWINADSVEPIEAKITVYHGETATPHDLTPKEPGSTEYMILDLVIQKDEYVMIEYDGEQYGYNTLKAGGVADLFTEYTVQNVKYLKCNETHEYDIYVETDYAKADDNNKLMYIRADYIHYFKPSTNEWLNDECGVKTNAERKEYYTTELVLEAGAIFKARINGVWLGHSLLEPSGASGWISASDDGYDNCIANVAGVYDIYCKTTSLEDETISSIYVSGEADSHVYYYQTLAAGETTPSAPLGLELKPGVYDEFLIENVHLEQGDKIRIHTPDGYETHVKSGGRASYFNVADNNGYFLCNVTGNYDIYLKFMGDDLGIYFADYVPRITYTFAITTSNQWILNDNAKIYLWGFHRDGPDDGAHTDTFCHWYEGTVNENTITFSLPNNLNRAVAVRSPGMSNLEVWNDSEVWNKSDDFVITPSNPTIAPIIHQN